MAPWVVPFVTFLCAILASIVAYRVQRWRYQMDRLSTSVDQLCNEINSAADAASSYWLTVPPTDANLMAFQLAELTLIGRQARITELLAALGIQDQEFDDPDLPEITASLFDSFTGGSFQVAHREADKPRAFLAQNSAARLNGALKVALKKRVDGTLRRKFLRFYQGSM